MANKRVVSFAGVVTALGLTAAFLWLRDFISFVRRGGFERAQQDYARRRMVQTRMPNAQPIPLSGAAAPAPAGTQTGESPVLENLTNALVQHLVSFHSMVELVRSRQEAAQAPAGGSVLNSDDRANFIQTLDRLEQQHPIPAPSTVQSGSVQQRVYALMVKVHDIMRDPNIADDDLFRVYGEVGSQACQVLDEANEAGAAHGADYRYARTLYECN
jgi:hypothetical protein